MKKLITTAMLCISVIATEKSLAMNKTELIEAISTRSGLDRNMSSQALDAVLDSIADTLRLGDSVSIDGFGTFSVTYRAARTGRNPRTGQATQIEASYVPRFKAGKKLKGAVNDLDQTSVELEFEIVLDGGMNCISAEGDGIIPVTIFGNGNLDVNQINVDPDSANSIYLSSLGVGIKTETGPNCSIRDLNADGIPDLDCQFRDDPDRWWPGDDQAMITGTLVDGTPVQATHSVCVR